MTGLSPSIILTEEHLREVRDHFLARPAFAFDTEAQGENRGVPHLNSLSWLSLATDGMAVVIPFGHPIGDRVVRVDKVPTPYGDDSTKAGKFYNKSVPVYEPAPEQLYPETVFRVLEPLFFSPVITKIAHGASFDFAALKKYYGRVPCAPYEDTIIDAWLLDENRRRFGLKHLVRDIFHFSYDDEEIGTCVESYPFSKVALYSYLDARLCWLLYQRFSPQIEADGLEDIHRIEHELLPVMVNMRLTGALVDEEEMHTQKIKLGQRVENLKFDVFMAASRNTKPHQFNLNSTPQKQKLLYGPKSEGGQGLKTTRLTKSARKKKDEDPKGFKPDVHSFSTDEEALQENYSNPLAAAILAYQETFKILGTYIIGYLGDPGNPGKPRRIYDGRIHADFVQYGTKTGRFSCREPNLQNIPRPSSDLGRTIRGLFISESGHKLVVADFAQIELVVLAHYIGYGALFDTFHAGGDPHRMTAAMVLGKSQEEVTKDERQDLGKTLGFATVYGAGVKKVAAMAKVSDTQAREILNEHKRRFPEVYGYRQALLRNTRKAQPYPCLTTLLGRKRRILDLLSPDDKYRMPAERQCFNSLIQGSAADLQKLAMIRAYNDPRRGEDIKMLMTVHDEIVLSAPDSKTELAEDILREAMTGPAMQDLVRVPLSIEVNTADRWSEAK